jgi:FHA domain
MTVGVRRKLIVKDGTGEREVPLAGTVSVGRDPSCEISANDPALSRHHAEFLETGRGILVRDLRSQNGIKVNSVAVREAILQPGDIVSIAALILRYVEEMPESAPAVPAAAAAPPDTKAERTVLLGGAPPGPPATAPLAAPVAPPPVVVAPPPPAPAAPPLASVLPPAAATPQDDSTRYAAPPPPPAAAPVPLANLVGPPPGPSKGDSDRTNMMPFPPQPVAAAPAPAVPPARSTGVMPVAPPAPPPVPQRPRVSSTERAAQELAATKVKAATNTSWAGRVLLRVLMLTLAVSLLSAIPLMVWHQQQMNAVTLSRATALANLLAADASLALTSGKDLESAPNEVLEQPGVVAARILAVDGRVMAPAPRSAENITAIPGINAAPGDILRLRSEWNGDRLEVIRPVAAKGQPRAALAWVTISPTTEFNGSSLVVTAPVVVFSLLLGWIVAWRLTAATQKGFAKLNEDVELALSGRADVVRDTIGAKPITDLTNTINYLLARLHGVSGEPGAAPAPAADGPGASKRSTLVVAVPSSPSPVTPPVVIPPPAPQQPATPIMGTPAPPPAPARPAPAPSAPTAPAAVAPPPAPAAAAATGAEARILVDTGFHVTEASPGCASLLGVRPDSLVGRHLLDAIADRQIADAVLGCLSALPPGAGERQAVTADGNGRRLVATVSRPGKDKPITITLRPAES